MLVVSGESVVECDMSHLASKAWPALACFDSFTLDNLELELVSNSFNFTQLNLNIPVFCHYAPTYYHLVFSDGTVFYHCPQPGNILSL